MRKTLTIIVPSYNMEVYIARCIDSLGIDVLRGIRIKDDEVLADRLEVLIVNDGSTDKTSSIAHEFEEIYPEIVHVIDKKNGHYGSCINRGLAEAKGTFVKILDADDTFDADAFKTYLRFLVETCETGDAGEIDLVISDFQIVDIDGCPLDVLRSFPYPKGTSFDIGILAKNDMLWYRMHAVTYRTERLRGMNYKQIEGVMYSDSEWTVVPLCVVRKIRYCPVRLYLYLMGREGQSMAPGVWGKNLSHRTAVILDIVRSFVRQTECSSEENKMLVSSLVYEGLKSIYTTSFLKCNVENIDNILRPMDVKLAKTDKKMHERIRNLTFPSRRGLHVVRFWQDHTWSSRLISYYMRLYSRLVKSILWFARKR